MINHLTDTELQKYLERPGVEANEHLQQCEVCKQSLAVYRRIAEAAVPDDVPLLRASFADNVIAKLPFNYTAAKSRVESVLLASLLVFFITAVIYFFNFSKFFTFASDLNYTQFIEPLKKWLVRLNINGMYVGLAFSIMLIVELVDRRWLRKRHKVS